VQPDGQASAPSPEGILQLGTAFWASKTLLSAIELGLFTELAASGPLDAARSETAGKPPPE